MGKKGSSVNKLMHKINQKVHKFVRWYRSPARRFSAVAPCRYYDLTDEELSALEQMIK